MAAAKEKASACCSRDAPARVAGAPVVPMRAIAASPVGKVVALAAGGGERVAASAAGASGAVIEEIAAVQPTTAKASSKGIRNRRHLPPSPSLCPDEVGSYFDWVMTNVTGVSCRAWILN